MVIGIKGGISKAENLTFLKRFFYIRCTSGKANNSLMGSECCKIDAVHYKSRKQLPLTRADVE